MARTCWRRTVASCSVLGAEDDALGEKLRNLVAEGRKKIVLNLNNIEYIDSAGSEH
jgi:hypothetical protein